MSEVRSDERHSKGLFGEGTNLAHESKEIRCNFCSRTSKDLGTRIAVLYSLVSIFPTKICEHCLQAELDSVRGIKRD